MCIPYHKIKFSEVRMFLEDGGRTLVRAGDYELKDGIKNGTKSFVVIDYKENDVFLIPEQEAVAISDSFAVMPDLIKAKADLEALVSRMRQSLT